MAKYSLKTKLGA
ncbi:Protein of unknown function [Bacillus mycoides]|uniref:Uncharacterized protein n=1 Tax=Bacillus mycoides TaxID=1405 RepID=A0A1C4AGB4_BACMY|nr:Protein of unknown function [Bacillus mycoides]SCB93605.1 Protein of unknown function [Bacillus mycoides]